MKKPKQMFLHPLIDEAIAHSLYVKRRRNFALRSHTQPYMEMVIYRSILFANTAIKYALDTKSMPTCTGKMQFDAYLYKGMYA